MTTIYRISEAAAVLGVSDDTIRRWIDGGRLTAARGRSGPARIEGAALAALARNLAAGAEPATPRRESARNRIAGIVTRVVRDTVMAQVEMQCGPYRLVSLMSREAADELGLEPGSRAVAAVKATNVIVEVP
ncbi:MAG: TOBE domain-containing protein [Actinomycetota bacterium]|nr:TOBE domain-containing protein [Actinomycetota bacterium]